VYQCRKEKKLKLVISEKPSVVQSIAAVIDAKQRGDGFWEGGGYFAFHGVSAISRSWQAPTLMIKNTPNGGGGTCPSCRKMGQAIPIHFKIIARELAEPQHLFKFPNEVRKLISPLMQLKDFNIELFCVTIK